MYIYKLYYFIWQLASLFINALSRDVRQSNAHRYSSFPWVGIRAL